jgi:DNA mismatch repair protein MutL
MPKIRVLPPEVVNRIAAGEVIERPASVVKELVENSIDAGATEILVDLEEGGIQRLTVRDNGCGIDADELPLALSSHATSKLGAGDEDLFSVATLGFRGEALASMGSVADVEIVSRPPHAEHAFRFRPGMQAPEPAAAEVGTVVEVRGLFARVPARRKFLRQASTELSQAVGQLTRVALAYPRIRFLLTHKGKRALDLAACSGLKERLLQVLGEDREKELIEVREESRGARLYGFVGAPKLRRSDARGQNFFVNGRWIRDRLLAHALRSAYQGFLIPGYHPVGYLFLEFPAGAVDVNVHPTKCEVRFRDTGEVYPLILHAVRRALEPAKTAVDSRTLHGGPKWSLSGGTLAPSGSGDDAERDSGAGAAFDAATESFGARKAGAAVEGLGDGRSRVQQSHFHFDPPHAVPATPPADDAAPAAVRDGETEPSAAEEEWPPAASGRTAWSTRPSRCRAFQVLNSYIAVEEADGLVLIDQHALHEKILFEEICRALESGSVLRQRQILPEAIELPLDCLPLVDTASQLLGLCGFEVAPFGERHVAVHAVPRLFDRDRGVGSTREIVLGVFAELERDGAEGLVAGAAPEAVLSQRHRLASVLACKRAVKAGTVLSPQEIDGLLERADLADDPRHCPHGRPTSVRISRREVERRFDRK